MALYPQSFLDDLRLQADIVTVVQDVVALKRVGNRYSGLCPFHGEKTPSFSVNREQGLFYCFGCQVGGNVFKFVELHEKVSFPDLPNTEKTVKTMADELKNDIAQFGKERQAVDELLAKITDANKALEVQSDVHRAMCITAQDH